MRYQWLLYVLAFYFSSVSMVFSQNDPNQRDPAEAFASGGVATWYNPAWLFLTNFYKVYLRVSQGASRLQEVLADRWAALLYGPKSFEKGLEQSIRSGIRFDMITDMEVRRALAESRSLKNLYTIPVPTEWPEPVEGELPQAKNGPKPAEQIESQVEEAFHADPSPFDSHPSPCDRVRWINRMENVDSSGDDGTPAIQLFSDIKTLQTKMTEQTYTNVMAYIGYQKAMEEQQA